MAKSCRNDYRAGDSCPGCGTSPLWRGHNCFPDEHRIEDRCPACGIITEIWMAGELLFQADPHHCDEMRCPFCPACCARLGGE